MPSWPAPAAIAAWQLYERSTTGAMPAAVLAGYFRSYGFQALAPKISNAVALFIHSWFIVFPALAAAAFVLAWQRRREPETVFLLAWIVLFFGGAVVVFFAGSARTSASYQPCAASSRCAFSASSCMPCACR